jgi:hypothetical protein
VNAALSAEERISRAVDELTGLGATLNRRCTVTETYTARAVAAVLAAARSEHDFAGWLARVLAAAAGQLGSSDALTADRLGSWEAADVDHLVKGTVGYDDAYLPGPLRNGGLTDAKAREIKDAALWAEATQREIAAEFGVSPSMVSDIATGKTWGWLRWSGVHDVRFYASDVTGMYAECRPCRWRVHVDGGHDLGELGRLVTEHSGDTGPRYTTGVAPSGAALSSAEDVGVLLGALADAAWWQAQHGTPEAAARYRTLARSLGDDRG